jgi:hypothetical protein
MMTAIANPGFGGRRDPFRKFSIQRLQTIGKTGGGAGAGRLPGTKVCRQPWKIGETSRRFGKNGGRFLRAGGNSFRPGWSLLQAGIRDRGRLFPLSQGVKHMGLISLHPRLIERIHAQERG